LNINHSLALFVVAAAVSAAEFEIEMPDFPPAARDGGSYDRTYLRIMMRQFVS
jgi:hypothetical protein